MNDIKISGTPVKTIHIQSDIHKVGKCVETWQLNFNISKCKVMHVGRRNQILVYMINQKNINEASEEKYLRVLLRNTNI